VSSISAPAIEAQLERILASREFARSGRMSRFLRYTVELALAGQASEIKEYRIGVDVFDRRADYDPRVDPIVRVEARRLRDKLAAYYKARGGDEVVICFDKGGYAPVFRRRGEAGAQAETPAPARAPDPHTVAVLPLADLSPGGGHQYFSDGLTEELIHALTRASGLRVVAWGSAAQFRGEQPDVRAAAEQLGVANALTGSVRISGARLRVRAQLIDAASGAYLWSETYDRELSDVFAIQEEIARAIVRTLRVRLSEQEGGQPMARAGGDLDAYDLYLKGRYHWNKRTAEGLRRGARFFEASLALEPNSALALAGLADAYSLLADYSVTTPADVMPQARAAAERALALDPQLAEAWTSLAFIRSMYEWDWAAAGDLYRRAIALNPGYVTARFWYAVDYLAMLGRHEEAMESMNRVLQLDPLSITLLVAKGSLYTFHREFDAAVEYFSEMARQHPEHHRPWSSLGRAWERKGEYRRAVECLQRARSIGGDLPYVVAALGQAQAAAGDEASARAMLAELERLRGERFVQSTGFALIHMSLGETDRALAWIEEGCERRELALCSLRVHPIYDALRGEARFERVLRRIWSDL
jgi:serine/threonine-protein kinase